MTRVEQALAEIARRRTLAKAAARKPWGGMHTNHADDQAIRDQFVAANDPAHVLAVLDAAEATLRRHAQGGPDGWRAFVCFGDHRLDWDEQPDTDWPCPDAAAVLDIYAPEVDR